MSEDWPQFETYNPHKKQGTDSVCIMALLCAPHSLQAIEKRKLTCRSNMHLQITKT